MGLESMPQLKPKVETPRMTFGERIAKGEKEGDPKWETAKQKVDIINKAMQNLDEKNSAEKARRMKEAQGKVWEYLGKEERDTLYAGYDALKDLYMAEEPEGPKKWEKQKAVQKALELAERINVQK